MLRIQTSLMIMVTMGTVVCLLATPTLTVATNVPDLSQAVPIQLNIWQGIRFNGKVVKHPICQVTGLFVGFNWNEQGFIAVSSLPFKGALIGGKWEKTTLKFEVPGIGQFELPTLNQPPTPVQLWVGFDPSFPKGPDVSCYASNADPMICRSDMDDETCLKLHQDELAEFKRLMQNPPAWIKGFSIGMNTKGDVIIAARCGSCEGLCCGINPDGTCWASDTTRKPRP